MKIVFLNIYGQSGFSLRKIIELENFLYCNKIDIACLQETNIEENTFSDSNIPSFYNVTINNNRSGYGTCTLVKKHLPVENVVKDTDGRLISVDVNNMSIVNLYLQSGNDKTSKSQREDFISNTPNILLYKRENGLLGGDLNSIVDQKDSINYPGQKMSECFKKLINLYKLQDAFRKLYPHAKQYSRYYTWKGKEGATRIDRCYTWGNVKVKEAEYLPISFSDHFAHVVTIEDSLVNNYVGARKKEKSLYKIKHFIVEDKIFQENVRKSCQEWVELKKDLYPTFWWEEVVKKGIKDLALSREKELNLQRRRKLAGLQLRLSYHLKRLKVCQPENFNECLTKLECVKNEMQNFYQERAKIILSQNRAEVFDMSDSTKIYHYESLNKYVKKSEILKLEVDGEIFEGQAQVEKAINGFLEESLNKKFDLDLPVCEELFSFQTPQISKSMDDLLNKTITKEELEIALKQLNHKASPGIDGIPSTVYTIMSDLFAPHMLDVFNNIAQGSKPPVSMRTSTIQFLTKPKKANSIKLSDKRRISVLCTDFKCLETIFANRLNKVMPLFISTSQYASKPKKIHQGISAARDLVSFAKKKKVDMAVLQLDMKSGFDLLQMEFVYFCFKKYGFSDKTINIFKNIYGSALALSVVNGKSSKLITDSRETLRQGGSGSMGIFNVGVNPVIQLLESKLEGVTLYSQPVLGPVPKNEERLPPITHTEKTMNYVDDLNPIVTKVEEFKTVDSCLVLFEKASGCEFHRDPNSQKCKVTPFGKWKQWLTQDNVPLPFLLVTETLEILGVKIFESYSDTRRDFGSKMVEKIETISNIWKGGRFYDFLLRPHVVNTYLFSNVWHKGSVIELLCEHSDKIQSLGNKYVFRGCYFSPERVVNYLDKSDGGLQINNIRSKSKAIFIKNFLNDVGSNVYTTAVFRKYIQSKEVFPAPVKPDYLNDILINLIREVIKEISVFSTKNIYKVLLKKQFNINENFKLKIELEDNTLENVMRFTDSKMISVSVRSFVWKFAHNILYSEINEAKTKLTIPCCDSCGEVDIDYKHCFFVCEKVYAIASKFLEVLKIFDPAYSFEEVIKLKSKEEFPHVNWFIAYTLYYIYDNRKRCSLNHYITFLQTEYEVLKFSKKQNIEEEIRVLNMMIELLQNDSG